MLRSESISFDENSILCILSFIFNLRSIQCLFKFIYLVSMIFMFTSVLATFHFQTQFVFWPWMQWLFPLKFILSSNCSTPLYQCIMHLSRCLCWSEYGFDCTIKKNRSIVSSSILLHFKFYFARKCSLKFVYAHFSKRRNRSMEFSLDLAQLSLICHEMIHSFSLHCLMKLSCQINLFQLNHENIYLVSCLLKCL